MTGNVPLRTYMKTDFRYVLTKFILYFIFPVSLHAQNLTGIWKGYFITKDFSQYKVEFQLKQSNRELNGVSYSYLTTVYYGKATMTGQFQKTSHISIQEIRTVESKSSDGGGNCLMNFSLMYSISGREEYLEGTFTSKFEADGEQSKKGEDCGDGRIYLRRVKSSDFYPEPFLQNSMAKKVIINEAPVKRTVTAPSKGQDKKEETTAATSNLTTPTEKPTPHTPNTIAADNANTTAALETQPVTRVSNNRLNDLLKVLTVKTPEVKVLLYDNGEVDGDTVSVYLNNKIVLSQKRLSTIPLQLSLQLDPTNNIQEITIVAENLGRIPPNSALMIVNAGDQQFRVQITSTEQKNAVVRFRYEPPSP